MTRPPFVPLLAVLVLLAAAVPAVLAAPVLGTGPPTPLEAFRARRTADSLWARQEYGAAAVLYSRVLDANPRDGFARLRLGAGLQAAGHDAEGVPHLEAALVQGFGTEMRVAYGLAQAAARAGQKDDAFRWLDRALAARYEDRPDIAGDSAFVALHDDPRFAERAGRPAAAVGAADRVAGWRADLAFLREEARRLHAAPSRAAFSPAFTADLEALAARVPELDDTGVALAIQSILATRLADGHTTITPIPTERVTFATLPLGFWFFPDGLYVVAAAPAHESLIGARVVAMGGKSTDVLPNALAPFVSRDNEQGLVTMGLLHLQLIAELRALGFTDQADRVMLTVEQGGRRRDVTVQAGDGGAHLGRGLPPAPGAPVPTWQARAHDPYWHEDRPGMDALYVQINQVQNAPGGPSLAAYARTLREALEASGRRNLVLDLRRNHGGNNGLLAPLVRLVAWHETEAAGRRTWVITGRETFSACQNLVNQLERTTSAIFVGEESGSKPNFTGEDTAVVLPWSGLRASISSRWWQDGTPHDRRPFVPVALKIVPTADDWRAGRDPVMAGLAEAIGVAAP